MKVLRQLFLGTAIAAAAMSSHAQKTYSLNPTSCGTAPTAALYCLIDVGGPQPPLDEYSWGTFNLPLSGDTGTIAWENLPMGELGTSEVDSSRCTGTKTYIASNGRTLSACSGLSIQISGNCLPKYGGAPYTGTVTINLSYSLVYVRYRGYQWHMFATGGQVVIN